MKIKRNLLLVSYCVSALVLVVIDSVIQDVNFVESNIESKIVISVVLMLSFIYLHYGYQSYLIPKLAIAQSDLKNVEESISNYYNKSFFKGAIGLGYICVLISVGGIFSNSPDVNSYVMAGVIFVVLGIAAKARGAYMHIAYISHNEKTHNNSLHRTSR